ncbi:MAG: PQQ-binding-like beta-propeller repeat protein [Lachnospiraceae bacterium]|nr:PQQ-binding-like beta-propeller repeat protein [Lachnospiraceae bacterium]
MGKNRGRNKKKVAQQKQERLNNLIEEQVVQEEERNPWKELRREIEQQKSSPSEKSSDVDVSRLKSKKFERARQELIKKQTEDRAYLNERKEEDSSSDYSVTTRRYMYDSARNINEEIPEKSGPDKSGEKDDPKTDKVENVSKEQKSQTTKALPFKPRRKLSKKTKKTITVLVSVFVVCSLVVGFFAFKFMVKYGSLKYLYNYFNDTKGSLRYETDLVAAQGADEDVPRAVDKTDPAKLGVKETVQSGDWIVKSVSRLFTISFDTKTAADAPISGFFTFRGNYRRDASSVGAVTVQEGAIEKTWDYDTGKLLKNNGSDYWSGNGWTGQPLVAQWDDSVRRSMNMYDSAKEKTGLVEVIYPGMDGKIHFLDLDTGEETRPEINVGMTFKGTASIYPDGTPLLFCGCGDAQTGPFGENVSQRFYIYSLIDGKLLYDGGIEDDFAPRKWHAYDSSPLIDKETDTLIYPGENGVIYTMKLNTAYDKKNATISVKPSEFIKYTFTIDKIYGEDKRVWGSECSACAWNGYIFLGDNAGMFYCLDVNTMNMVWITDLKEDINSSPILSFEDDGTYIYIGTTLKYGYDEHSMGEAAIYKLNAVTGETVWKKGYEVHTVKGYAGGVLSTGVVGKGEIGDYVIYSVSKTPSLEAGYLVALDKKTGHEEWRITLDMYSWSSTVLTYDRDGKPLIIQGCQNGDLLLIDARDGKILNKINFGSAIEATPVMYANRLVIATRGEKIYGAVLK